MNTYFSSYLKYGGVLLCSALLLFSCSKDDNPGNEPQPIDPTEKEQLVLDASKTQLTEGDKVTFKVTAAGKAIDADIYIGSEKLKTTTHTFTAVGEYQVVAKKASYKDSESLKITVTAPKKKVASATVSKVTTRSYPSTYEEDYYDRIAIGRNYIYVYNSRKNEFKRYSVSLKQWSSLAPPPSGARGGIAGYLTYHATADDKDVLLYLGGNFAVYTYYPPEYPDGNLRNTWKETYRSPTASVESGERGAASDGQYVYYMGNGRKEAYAQKIDRYNPSKEYWEEQIGSLPVKFDKNAQAVAYDNKLFVVGENSVNAASFVIYDLQRKEGKVKPDPRANWYGFSGSKNNTLVVYQDYLIYQSASGNSVTFYVYDIQEDKWLDKPVSIAMDLFSDSRNNASLLLHASGTLYMAGTKAGDFVLYEVDFKVTEE